MRPRWPSGARSTGCGPGSSTEQTRGCSNRPVCEVLTSAAGNRIRMRRHKNSPELLESDLRALRTPARRMFIGTLAAHVRERSVRDRRRPLGVALAFALTGAIVVSLAAVGGLGYAASASKRSAVAVSHVVSPALKRERSVARQTPAQAQYQVTICHRTGVRSRPWTQLSVNTTSVKTYL